MDLDINNYRIFNKLKSVYRFASVGDRKESVAEHSWGCLMLADFFLAKMETQIDRLRVYELLMYHDVVEIETGDIPIHPELSDLNKKESEFNSAKRLAEVMPGVLKNKYVELFFEFEEQKTIEARFAKAIDALEAEIHELDFKADWKGWTKEFLLKKKAHLFNEFPEMKKVFDEIIIFLVQEKYLDD